jgi:hypothetical protein
MCRALRRLGPSVAVFCHDLDLTHTAPAFKSLGPLCGTPCSCDTKSTDIEDEYRLSLVMLMHVKCIYDLCTLPLDIPPYLHHILVIFMLFDDYWE